MSGTAKEILIEAKEAVMDAELPENLQEIAFESVLQMLSNGQVQANSNTSGFAQSESNAPVNVNRHSSGDNPKGLNRLAQELALSVDKVERIFLVEDESVDIIINPKLLPNSNAGATKDLTLLTAVGRQCSGLEEETHIEQVREVCEDFGVYDGPNFAASVTSLRGDLRIQGKGQERQIKITRNGVETVKGKIQKFLGDES